MSASSQTWWLLPILGTNVCDRKRNLQPSTADYHTLGPFRITVGVRQMKSTEACRFLDPVPPVKDPK